MVQLQTVPRILLSDLKLTKPGLDQKLGSGLHQYLDSNLKSWTEDMGNLCNIQAGGARVGTLD